jgi:seryl-tRNA synthetase
LENLIIYKYSGKGVEMSKEYITFYKSDTNNLNFIDNYFQIKAVELGAEQYHIPAMIGKDVLDKCGYFDSFPHHITGSSFINPASFQTISKFGNIDDIPHVCHSDVYFTPAACLHIYPMIEGEKIEQRIITTKARVYRYENDRFDGKYRLWDFTVREIVFIGKSQFVLGMLQKFKDYALVFCEYIGLNAHINQASDHFYPSTKNKVKEKLQISNSLKDELITTIDGEEVAIASFNMHGHHFSKPFNFDNDGEIVSGCVGFGLERWVAALSENNIILDYKG